MSGAQNPRDQPEQTVRGLEAPAPPRESEEGGEDGAPDERTSPFPYAEKFDEWVADETATPDGRQRRAAERRR
jgi:hypothetical protein